MPAFLRSIALTVDEPEPGLFYWVLLESAAPGQPYQVLTTARSGQDSFESALDAGAAQFRAICGDRRSGPRREYEDADANPSGWTPLI